MGLACRMCQVPAAYAASMSMGDPNAASSRSDSTPGAQLLVVEHERAIARGEGHGPQRFPVQHHLIWRDRAGDERLAHPDRVDQQLVSPLLTDDGYDDRAT